MQTGSWGSTIFLVSSAIIMTPGSVSLGRDAKYEDHPVQGDFPRPEFISPGLLTVSLAVLLRADLGVDPYGEAEALDQALIAGEVRRLVLVGENLGKFTLRKLSQGWRFAMKSRPGPLAIDLGMELTEYY